MIWPPSPSWIDDGSSPMIAPTTLAVADTLSAAKMYGSAAGTRSFQRMRQFPAAYDLISSSARRSAECSPRIVLIVTGKNVRYAAITATAPQSWKRVGSFGFSQTTTIGATTRIGTVCDATTHGRK